MKRFVFVVLIAILVPQTLFAAWWNPFSWKVFNKISPAEVEVKSDVVTTTTDGESEVEKLLKKVEELEKKVDKQSGSQASSQKTVQTTTQNTQVPKSSQADLSKSNIAALVSPAVVHIRTGMGTGSGAIIDGHYVLTNAHVVGKYHEVEITLSNGKKTYADLWGIDEDNDLALLTLPNSNFSSIIIGNSSNLRQGDEVYVFGYPFGYTGEASFKEGTLSRRLTEDDGAILLETSAEAHHGNSGGPLIDSHGKLVGILSQRSPDVDELGALKFAIDINYAKPFIQYMKEGRQLRKNKSHNSDEEIVYRKLQGLYDRIIENDSIDSAVYSSHDQPSFSYYNSNLHKNDPYIKKRYLQDLIEGVGKNLLALEVIMETNKDLQGFTASNRHTFENLPNIYQKKIVNSLIDHTLVKTREYGAKYGEWISVKRKYEDQLKNLSTLESTYLQSQESYLLSLIKYIKAERDTLLNFTSHRSLF